MASRQWDDYVKKFVKASLSKYQHKDKAQVDVFRAFSSFTDLEPRVDKHTFKHGNQLWLLCITGKIPVLCEGKKVPISVMLMDHHPYAAPLCHVKPTPDMVIIPSEYVDDSGRIHLSYLRDWKYPQSDLTSLLQVMTSVFSEQCSIGNQLTLVSGSGKAQSGGLNRGGYFEGKGDICAEPHLGYFLHCNIPPVSAENLAVQQNLDECYDMRTREKGLGFLLNLHYYENSGQEIRKGSEMDVANIRHVMGQAGFSFQDDMVLKDVGYKCIKTQYMKFIERCKGFNDLKCIAVILMAHGGLGYINCELEESHRTRKIPLAFFFDELEKPEEFKEIPKIFIIQACRQVSFDEDAPGPPSPLPEEHSIRIYSSLQGAGSARDWNKGSLFCQAFVKVLLENAHKEHLMDMLQKVRIYAEELRQDTPYKDKKLQKPDWEENLKKKLYLVPHTP